jgi:hypothetical protein
MRYNGPFPPVVPDNPYLLKFLTFPLTIVTLEKQVFSPC